MNTTDDTTWICPSRPFGHDWNGGLHCRGCDATRTAQEALESRLAGQPGWDNTRAATLVELHAREARSTQEPLVVSRFDVGMEPAPEEEQLFTVGAIAEDGRPVALVFDEETRRKVGGWLAPAGLTASVRQFLTSALDLAEDAMLNRGPEFNNNDEAALAELRHLAGTAEAATP